MSASEGAGTSRRGRSDHSVLTRARRTVAGSGRRLVEGLLHSGTRLSWFGLAAALATLVFVTYFQSRLHFALQVGAPLAEAAAELEAGLDRSLVELRGWVAYRDPAAPQARAETWESIDAAMQRLQRASDRARIPALQEAASDIAGGLRELRVLQWIVEDVAGTPGNRPAQALYDSSMAELRNEVQGLLDGLLRSGRGDIRAGIVSVSALLRFQTLFVQTDAALQQLLRTGQDTDEVRAKRLAKALEKTARALGSAMLPPDTTDPVVKDQFDAFGGMIQAAEAYLGMLPRFLALQKRPDVAQAMFNEQIRPVLQATVGRTRDLSARQRAVRSRESGRLFRWSFVVLILALILAGISGGSIYVQGRLARRVGKAMARAHSLGQYVLRERIGAGGMGEVYRAEHSMLQRPSALKLLKPGTEGLAAYARFEDEVKLTSRLSHPNTIAIYDYGRTPQGVFYYVMELLDGVTLDALVERTGPLPPARAVHVLKQVCLSLAEAHDEGLLHRDVKPSNIMLARVGGVEDTVKVLDFGLATRAGRPTEDQDTLVGTPRYMAPEIIRGAVHASPASDIYALGCVGYLLLTGRPVFEVEGVDAVLDAHLHRMPTRPSARAQRPILSDLDAIILSCLAKNPDDRPESARALHDIFSELRLDAGWGPKEATAWWSLHGESLRAWVAKDRGKVAEVSRIRVLEADSTQGSRA